MTASHILHATDSTFAETIERPSGLTLVDLRAPWCPPCLLLAPVIDRVATAYASRVRVVKMNVDESPTTADRFGVRSIPTLLLFEDGQVVASLVGAVPQSRVEALLDAHLPSRAG